MAHGTLISLFANDRYDVHNNCMAISYMWNIKREKLTFKLEKTLDTVYTSISLFAKIIITAFIMDSGGINPSTKHIQTARKTFSRSNYFAWMQFQK